jgi:hypothetical protein
LITGLAVEFVNVKVVLLNNVVPSYHFGFPLEHDPFKVILSPEQIADLLEVAFVGAAGIGFTLTVTVALLATGVSQVAPLLVTLQPTV